MKISALCDRKTDNVVISQIGFMKFGPLPLFKVISLICPSKAAIQHRLEQNGLEWEAYAENESEKHKQVYIKRPGQGFLDESWP